MFQPNPSSSLNLSLSIIRYLFYDSGSHFEFMSNSVNDFFNDDHCLRSAKASHTSIGDNVCSESPTSGLEVGQSVSTIKPYR